MKFITFSFIWLTVISNAFSQTAYYYVSPDGSDENPGSLIAPLAGISKAQEMIRTAIQKGSDGPFTIYFRQGNYYLNSTVTLGSQDSGVPDSPILWRAYPGEEVSWIGGKILDPDWFTPVTDPVVLNRLPAESRNVVLVTDLTSHGITQFGQLVNRGFRWDFAPGALEIFIDGVPLTLARYPDNDPVHFYNGFSEIEKVIPDSAGGNENSLSFTYYFEDQNRPLRWTQAKEIWAFGWFRFFWADAFVPVTQIDTAQRTITLADNGGYGIEEGNPYYLFNLLEEITQPGEWYLDRTTGKLYLYPPYDLTHSSILVSTLNTMIDIRDASHITFENILFQTAQDRMININNSTNIRFRNCTFRNGGTDAAFINGSHCALEGCAIYNMGDGAVILRGGNRATLTPGENVLSNSYIHHLSRWGKTYKPAALVEGCGHRISHNLIHDLPAIAVLYNRSNNHRIEYNHIFNVCRLADDNGAIYSGRDWASQGNQIRFNYIHDVKSLFWGFGVHAIYLDDGISGQFIFGNILKTATGRAVMINGGRDNIVDNNLFLQNGTAIYTDRLLQSPFFPQTYTTLRNRLLAFDYQNPPWSQAYPHLVNILEDDPKEPKGNKILRNLGCGNTRWTEEGHIPGGFQFFTFENNVENQDPLFIDPNRMELGLQYNSPAWNIPGFQPIPFDQIGLIPESPTVHLQYVSADTLALAGSCESWAQIKQIAIPKFQRDLTPWITLHSNGHFSGQIPASVIDSFQFDLQMILTDPLGREFPFLLPAQGIGPRFASSDSLGDPHDRKLPFGLQPAGFPQTAQILVTNNAPTPYDEPLILRGWRFAKTSGPFQMIDPDTGNPIASHPENPAEFRSIARQEQLSLTVRFLAGAPAAFSDTLT